MKKSQIQIKTISPYLQARFSEQAKDELLKDAKKSITRSVKEADEQWIRFSYFDEAGYYIPTIQIEMAIQKAAKQFKMKSARSSCYNFARANLFVEGDKTYIGRKEPDELETSYPSTKLGMRVRNLHPKFNEGLKVDFVLQCLDDNFSDDIIKNMIEEAGRTSAIGARRPKYGRFEVIKFKKL